MVSNKIEWFLNDETLDLDTVAYKDIVEKGKEEEHEYLYMSAGQGENKVDFDVYSFEGVVEVFHDVDISLREFTDNIERFYPVYRSGDVFVMDGEYRKFRHQEPIEEIDPIMFDYFFEGGLCFSWESDTAYKLDDESLNQISMAFPYLNTGREAIPSAEPLEKILPNLMKSNASEKNKRKIVNDLIRYINDVSYSEDYTAVRGCSGDIIENVYEIEN